MVNIALRLFIAFIVAISLLSAGIEVAPYTFIVIIVAIYWIYAWKKDIWVVTNQRVIDESGVLARRTDECPLDKINNVTYNQSLIGRIFNYGNVMIQTAAGMGANAKITISSPKQFKDEIVSQQEKYQNSKIAEQAESLAKTIRGESVQEETKECPFCAEKIKAKAKICRFCNKEVE